MEVLAVLAKSLGTSIGICFMFVVIFGVGMTFWVRSAVRDKVYVFVLSETKQLTGKLLKPVSNVIVVGKGESEQKYISHPTKQFWSSWPPGFPRYVQEPVPTIFCVGGNAEALDPFDRKSMMTPESLMKISDEAMLKQTWKDVKESVGLRSKPKTDLVLLIMIGIAVIASATAAFFSLSQMGVLDSILRAVGG